MISIIVCSVNPGLLQALKKNITETIGIISYEILGIDNSVENLGISKIYNYGLERAKYPFILCVHEDICFRTTMWGQILLNYFEENSQLGLIGIAGSKVKTKTPNGWWENEPDNWVMNLIQHYKNGKVEKIQRGFADDLEEVVVIDGVFLALRKDSEIKFDERIRGFHNYDQSISIRYRLAGYKIMVTREILIEHFSSGAKDPSWLISNRHFFTLYKQHLPQSVRNNRVSKEEVTYSYLRLINNLKREHKLNAMFYWLNYWRWNPMEKKTYRLDISDRFVP
ncbi:glycosyltransferase, partial [Autumnicola edwardsiae]